MGHALLKKAILLHKMANVQFDLLIAVALGMAGTNGIDLACLTGACKDLIQDSNAELHLKDFKSLQYLKIPPKNQILKGNQFVPSRSILLSNTL